MKNFLLDTNAWSEAAKVAPDQGFMQWFTMTDEEHMFTSCLVVGEILKGIELLEDGERKRGYEVWLDKIRISFGTRIVGVDENVTLLWGRLLAQGQKAGKTPPVVDTLIAAQCIYNDFTLVTRNRKDFEQFQALSILNPWST